MNYFATLGETVDEMLGNTSISEPSTQYQLVIKVMKKLHEKLFQEHGVMERIE